MSPAEDVLLFTLEALMVSLDCVHGGITPSESACGTGARASNISLSPCIHTYGNVTYENSVFDEVVLSTEMLPFVPMGY